MSRQLFGTDGIRGVAGEFPLDASTVYAIGRTLGAWCGRHHPAPEVLIGADTRESGAWIAGCLAAGLREEGVGTRFAGLITTPGVAYLTRRDDFVAGVMISASHNPYRDNGIKVFDHSGYKLADEEEHRLEEEIFRLLHAGVAPSEARLEVDRGLDAEYAGYLASTLRRPLPPMKIAVDCGHGAASFLAPQLLERLGAEVIRMGCEPDGRNINEGCGALHVDALRKLVTSSGADAGFAFDGDADRCIGISGSGRTVDGDAILFLSARRLLAEGRLSRDAREPVVVSTVMSNLGLELSLAEMGVRMLRTAVGDRYVLEEMMRQGALLGGEQSGHIIFHEYATTGDGMLTALQVLEVLGASGRPLDELVAELPVYPQLLVNVRVRERRPLESLPAVTTAIRSVEEQLAGRGRVVVRFSGTEPLARVMVEGPTQQAVEAAAGTIAAAIRNEIGA